ncbi:DNA topoisomerase-3 [Dysgonomonas sp. PFB1-18]|uniref:type IA DNA topoisomerase n=1 Tax=unclassified Dysgonomonas TaxID=2630389 RepID=UPI00247434AA|nr:MULTISPECIES: type IA DNA topoisomerase [unclassified Dysgonomonas]MDH6309462.1 DNA topoisomerase-3 [Dysgonomonas sp. PF1-14]MDH6340872.1 DNA topoisomerase-3 [Dysgonomonas sp. PF1-16]MDH6382515.1 DNA topoisomerase-3 [Dysgonomonas sp. PFB1-18]MDH6399841.1 DNA topoisomerase-3 [Dysgonomonas sp. PF1-23]
MIAIITEKPSVGQDIARVLNITKKKNGYIEGNGYMVTWAYGHLVSLAYPEDYGIKSFDAEKLPVLPDPFKLIPRKTKTKKGYQTDGTAKKQLETIAYVFSKCDSIIVATDAGREGELIFRFIYSYLNCKKPFSRLWISSLTDSAIKEGFENLRDGSAYDNLYLAADARSKADWLLGINASRALCIASGDGNNSLGRVQTPTLAMICKRYLEVKNFKPQPFWQPAINLEKDGITLHLSTVEEFYEEEKASEIYKRLVSYPVAKVEHVEKKETLVQPPLLHDLTDLQKEANKKYGLTAEQTLSIAQKLYEAKLISYPRTASRYIPYDVFEKIPFLIDSLKEYPEFKVQASLYSVIKTSGNSVDDKKITDHHALIITENKPEKLSADEKKVYELIAKRMLEAFAGVCRKAVTSVDIACDDIKFRATQSLVTQQGWTGLFALADEDEAQDEKAVLPELAEGDFLRIVSCNLVQKKTKPKALFTDAGLLSAMESCRKEVEDQESKKAMKDSGIGTPATRAAIIETLSDRGYIERDKKNIVPTSKGLSLYNLIKNMRIADVEMTGGWENALSKIENSPDFTDSFMNGIRVYTRQVVDEIISVVRAENTSAETPYICPRCRLGKITFYNRVVKCNYSKCNLTFFREICGKKLTDNQLTELFKTGKSPLIKGFKNKEGESFDAHIVFDKNGNSHFVYPDRKKKNNQ